MWHATVLDDRAIDTRGNTNLRVADEVVTLMDLDSHDGVGPPIEKSFDSIFKGHVCSTAAKERLVHRMYGSVAVGAPGGDDRLRHDHAAKETVAHVHCFGPGLTMPDGARLTRPGLVQDLAAEEAVAPHHSPGEVIGALSKSQR